VADWDLLEAHNLRLSLILEALTSFPPVGERLAPLATRDSCDGRPRDAAAAQTGPGANLADLTIEELLAMEITTASRVPEGLATAPARVQAVTAALSNSPY
jgi:hypothetical protein